MIERKIKIEALDPCGIVIESSEEINYYNLGYKKPPEEYPIVNGIQHEPMKKVRYLLTIGDFKYLVNRKGEILEELNYKTW